MTQENFTAHHIVSECLRNNNSIDDKALVSLSILSEKLERLRNSSSLFSNVSFSPYVEKLKAQAGAVTVG